MREIIDDLSNYLQQILDVALVTVVNAQGSTPRGTGSHMLVDPEGQIRGTIGGGKVELLTIKEAVSALQEGKPCLKEFEIFEEGAGGEDGKGIGMLCGGKMTIFIEPLLSAQRLVIFGAGHVSRELASLAIKQGFRCLVVDHRPEWANQNNFPGAQVMLGDFEQISQDLQTSPRDFLAIMTYGHAHDEVVLRNLVEKPYNYLGMISSKRKRDKIFQKFSQQGVDDSLLARIDSPMGLPIKSKTPFEIAVSIMAKMIDILNKN